MNFSIRFFLTFLFFLSSSIILNAQSNISSVHLKNGSIIKGILLEQKESNQLLIQTEDGSNFLINKTEIIKIESDSTPAEVNYMNNAKITSEINYSSKNLQVGEKYRIFMAQGYEIKGEIIGKTNNGEIIIRNENDLQITIQPDQIIQAHLVKISSTGSLGVGFGIQYGLLGLNLDLAITDFLSFSAGVGHVLVIDDIAYNGGFKLFLLGPEHTWRPRLGIFYGINGIGDFSFDLFSDSEEETFRGFSIYAGQQIMFGASKSHGLDVDIVFLLTSGIYNRTNELKEMGYFVNSPGFVKFSIGYRFAF